MKNRLLYLEDDVTLAQMTIRALERKGFEVRHFESIAALRENYDDHSFTHALFDMKLDDGNSLGLIEELSKANGNLKIVLLTGYASIATAVQAVKLGAHNYLPKPASIEEILSAFDEVSEPNEAEGQGEGNTMSLKRLEWEKIQQALIENDGNITLTAKQLKMHRRTLQRKLNKRPVST